MAATTQVVRLIKRLWEHQNGLGASHTRSRLPVKLAYAEFFERVDDDFPREKQLQGWSRAKKKALIEGRLQDLLKLARTAKRKAD